jgi:steroid delta-isomerase-like uncharacterized protein
MDASAMDRLIDAHIDAETAGDPQAAISMYTDDVEHDVVGFPTGPVQGKAAAQAFYEYLVNAVRTETMVPTRKYYGDDFCVLEHQWAGTVPGSFLGVPGQGRRIAFRMLHVWEFRDGKIRRENVWLDGGTIVAQLTAPEAAAAATV